MVEMVKVLTFRRVPRVTFNDEYLPKYAYYLSCIGVHFATHSKACTWWMTYYTCLGRERQARSSRVIREATLLLKALRRKRKAMIAHVASELQYHKPKHDPAEVVSSFEESLLAVIRLAHTRPVCTWYAQCKASDMYYIKIPDPAENDED